MSVPGPTLAAPEVGSYQGYTGRDANIAAKTARDPQEKSQAACALRRGFFRPPIATLP